ncbi:hypothetical protein KC19_10G001300 [Ceratodon purpureus]|uniref:J domain-containing protein n=1 Tax=Ceratodon purpureus TaxID=3225 RepID=A0A8T0GIG1_CERPU|nr:hypothetical protein KC19_10G001300 [Ceratodon purpureus]
MWSSNRGRESETDRRRRMREQGREGPVDNDVKRQAGMWMVFFLGAAAVGNMFALRRRLLNIERQSVRGHSSQSRGEYATSGQSNRSYQSSSGNQTNYEDRAAQEAQRRWRAHLDEQQRTERIRRVKEAFAREKVSQANSYNVWHERRGDKWDWKWEGDRWEWNGEEQRERAQKEQDWQRNEEKKHMNSYELLKRARLAYHFTVLGLDATRPQPYSDADIKAAFRLKAFEYHPDQNPGNVQTAEVKFRQLLESYHLLKSQLKVK